MSVLVDDNDSSVQYNSRSGWKKFGQAPEFNATTHASATRGDTATLEFQGTSISVYGSIGPSTPGGRLNFSIDGQDAGSYVDPGVPKVIHNQRFWTSSALEEAPHTLVVTVDHDTALPTQVNPENRTFFLDYFVYGPAPLGKTQFIDDTDPNLIYSDHWNAANNSDGSLQGTFHTNKFPEAWAAIKFQGTGISLLGAAKGTSSYVIDSLPPVTIPSQSSGPVFQVKELSSGFHTLNITSFNSFGLAIDCFFVTPAGGNSATTTTTSGSDSQGVGTQAVAAASSSAGGSVSTNTVPIGAIVGGAVGGVVLLLLLVFGILFWRRRRARKSQPAFDYPIMSQQPLPDPWAHKRVSMTSLTTLTDDATSPRNFGKPRPPSRYIYYES